MVKKIGMVVFAGVVLASAAMAPDALARRGSGPRGRGPGSGYCQQQAGCRGDRTCDGTQQRLRDGSCANGPDSCPNRDTCPGPGTGAQNRGRNQGESN